MKGECTPKMMSSRGGSWLVLLSRFGGLFLLVALAPVSAQARPYAFVTNTGLSRVSVIDTMVLKSALLCMVQRGQRELAPGLDATPFHGRVI